MIVSLKKIVITLAIIIIVLTIIVISTLIKKINSNISDDNYITNVESFKIEKSFDLTSFEIYNNKIFLHLKSKNKEILRVYDLKSGKKVIEYELKNDF